MTVSCHPLFSLAAISVAILAAVFDGATGTIPNRLTLPVLVAAPLVHAILGGPGGLGASLLGVSACAAVPLALFLRGGMGGGDVKLLAAIGALVGSSAGLQIELCSLFAALAYSVVLLVQRRTLLHVASRAVRTLRHPFALRHARPAALDSETAATIRLGAPIGLATYFVLQAPHHLAWMVP
jgi:prepilin peptidase CpaA